MEQISRHARQDTQGVLGAESIVGFFLARIKPRVNRAIQDVRGVREIAAGPMALLAVEII